MPSMCVKAYKQGLLAPVQKAACKRNLALMPVLVSASRKVSEVCQDTFHRHRWNCSSIDLAPKFGQDIIRGTSEQAFVSSLASAGLAISVGRACAEGRIKICSCGRESKEPPPSDFKWGGCADNIGYGVKAAKAFSSEPFDREEVQSQRGRQAAQAQQQGRMAGESSSSLSLSMPIVQPEDEHFCRFGLSLYGHLVHTLS
ncbi:protein Wnt-11b-1 [Caerostris extrusa]|uniref:Protein Wnt n=1 Tax=Caerostris extrusa TaxID=172846 RepID=A0AAV4XM15_CAEEX|nr:protein Wnt-11b-1 [Caerostris extrusa]